MKVTAQPIEETGKRGSERERERERREVERERGGR
jgi:hypothetical protein